MEWHATAPKGGKMNKETDNLVIHDTKNYQIVLHPDDPDMLWYWIVNKENGLCEGRESLKPQALVYCEQYSLLLDQKSHELIAKNMVEGLAEEMFFDANLPDKKH